MTTQDTPQAEPEDGSSFVRRMNDVPLGVFLPAMALELEQLEPRSAADLVTAADVQMIAAAVIGLRELGNRLQMEACSTDYSAVDRVDLSRISAMADNAKDAAFQVLNCANAYLHAPAAANPVDLVWP